MSVVLLRPWFLTQKNRLLVRSKTSSTFNSDLLIAVTSIGATIMLYVGLKIFLVAMLFSKTLGTVVPLRLLSLSFLSFFFLLLFSNFVAALNIFFAAKDMSYLLALPLRSAELYTARLAETILTASWMFVLFGIPTLLAYRSVYELPWHFVLVGMLIGLLFLVLSAALSFILAALFVNFFPVARIGDSLAIAAFAVVALLLARGQDLARGVPAEHQNMHAFAKSIAALDRPNPAWLPSRWASDVLVGYLAPGTTDPVLAATLLGAITTLVFVLGFLVFKFLFMRGWTRATESISVRRRKNTIGGRGIRLPINPQTRAVVSKEVRMFLRDASQAMQLLLILTLTFMYLYNFRTLRSAVSATSEGSAWWLAMLSLSNISMGGCVTAAIATRFVFPSVSLEGRAYSLLRVTPMSIQKLLRSKVYAWIFPVMLASTTLLVSGAFAIQEPPEAIIISAVLGVALTIGIVTLGVGVGAVYVRLDWESPAQVASSFGTLLYMLLSLMVIFLTLFPASYLFFITCVPGLAEGLGHEQYLLSVGCSLFLVFFINLVAGRCALKAGVEALEELER